MLYAFHFKIDKNTQLFFLNKKNIYLYIIRQYKMSEQIESALSQSLPSFDQIVKGNVKVKQI